MRSSRDYRSGYGLGPVVAVSCKGMTGAFRNLTNRMEETVGECTNLHIIYPALVLGYLFVVRANRATVADGKASTADQQRTRRTAPNDIALTDSLSDTAADWATGTVE